MKKIYVTRIIPENGIKMLKDKGYEVDINPVDKILTTEELKKELSKKAYDAVLSLLTDIISAEIFDAVPTAKLFSNYAVGFNNIDIAEAKRRGIAVTNTPGVSSETVAEHAVALILALSCRIVEGDTYMKAGKYTGWNPMLLWGMDLKEKTVGILGVGNIGARVGHILSQGFGMNIAYYDIKRNEEFEGLHNATFYKTPEEVLKISDIVTLHVPLLPTTHHLINETHFAMMKKTAYLINTSRGPVVDEKALVKALQSGTIAGAGLDVFESEPMLAEGLADLPNVVLTPHIASATGKAREEMSQTACQNIIDFFEGKELKNKVD